MKLVIRPPLDKEMNAYFALRWKVLRKPWNQPPGSERDDLEKSTFHLIAVDEKNQIVACGRLQMNSPEEAQVRFMAVDPLFQGKGAGRLLMNGLEQEAVKLGATRVVLQAREKAVPFYQACGYRVLESTFLLYNEIQHFLMEKLLHL